MKTGVVIFPGSNCDQDMIYVVGKIMGQEVVELWHKDNDLKNCDVIILPGGFSYGDYLRSGAIARFSPIMEEVIKFANAGGIVFGVCNGFQVLCESHLLPGALLKNNNNKFICENIYIKSQTSNSILTNLVDTDKALKIPIAHGEGRFYCDDTTLNDLNNSSQILFRYCNMQGEINELSNPNGSIENIAGICNFNKNVFGMMPHPERAADEELFNTDGKSLFASLYSKVLA
ncbi:MAG: phosphoribosylformylglycinamidine synthase subunit PurQ [Bacteroidota bacterium]|jgi:phosphoribosylformylglycinamidine synthase I